ncbi:hypothetical protein [Candidatus Electronema sp. JM]|uniref:hypothetical protein n=1 Tax=Candidatus Electronema sp. JM TaxID=3401571 RepID=UPI003AA96683
MSGVMWLLFAVMLALLVLSLIWFVWKLREFSQSQSQIYFDDKLMQAMLKDKELSNKVKKALVKQASAGGVAEEEEDRGEEERKK